MKKVLVIQSRRAPGRCDFELCAYRRSVGDGVELSPVSTLDIENDWLSPKRLLAGYEAVIIGGSSDFFFHGGRDETDSERAGAREVLDRLRPIIEHILSNDIPTLGICFGHQLIAEIRGGEVTHDHAQKKMGTFDIRLTEEGKRDRLFSRLPETFAGQYAHRDSVTTLPQGAVALASGDSCRFSALRYGRNVYSVQFHPELTAQDLLDAREAAELYLSPGQTIESVVRESPEASQIMNAFIGSLT